MARTSLHDRLASGGASAPKGREALYQTPALQQSFQPEEPDRQPLTVNGQRGSAAERWEDSHSRVTFYCPVSLLKTIEDEVSDSGRSKSQIIVDALHEHLRNRRSKHE